MARRWDEYVEYEHGGVVVRVRCYGPGTANAIADQKRKMGFDNVRILGRPAPRRKDQQSVSYRGIQLHVWSRSGY